MKFSFCVLFVKFVYFDNELKIFLGDNYVKKQLFVDC